MRVSSTVQDLLLTALPTGGQRTARRNAWAGMSANAARARASREAAEALELAVQRARSAGSSTGS